MQCKAGPLARSKAGERDSSLAEAAETPRKTVATPPFSARDLVRSSSFSSVGSLSSSSEAGPSSASSSPSASSSHSLRRRNNSSDERRKNKATCRNKRQPRFPKPSSEPSMLCHEESLAYKSNREKCSQDAPHATYRRCMTDTSFPCDHRMQSKPAPDLLQLFNIFEFNTPERPAGRMLVNVTLVDTIHAVRLLVAYDACVQDVITASLKAYAKEGQLSRYFFEGQAYGLHYSPFCLDSIDPTKTICNLGTRSFCLIPGVHQPANTTQPSKQERPWWNILGLRLT